LNCGLKPNVYLKQMLDSFDPNNKIHVEWLKKLTNAQAGDLVNVFKENPMNASIPSGYETIQVFFGLCSKYAKAVLNQNAYLIH